jgi:hypothetical protein
MIQGFNLYPQTGKALYGFAKAAELIKNPTTGFWDAVPGTEIDIPCTSVKGQDYTVEYTFNDTTFTLCLDGIQPEVNALLDEAEAKPPTVATHYKGTSKERTDHEWRVPDSTWIEVVQDDDRTLKIRPTLYRPVNSKEEPLLRFYCQFATSSPMRRRMK